MKNKTGSTKKRYRRSTNDSGIVSPSHVPQNSALDQKSIIHAQDIELDNGVVEQNKPVPKSPRIA